MICITKNNTINHGGIIKLNSFRSFYKQTFMFAWINKTLASIMSSRHRMSLLNYPVINIAIMYSLTKIFPC